MSTQEIETKSMMIGLERTSDAQPRGRLRSFVKKFGSIFWRFTNETSQTDFSGYKGLL